MVFYPNWLFGGYVLINMLYLLLLRYDISKSQKGGCLREFPQAHSSVRGVCGSSRKLLASVRGICGSSRKLTQVCGAFAGVPASSLKCAGRLREFPQAHSSVRDVCGSSRKHALFLKMGIDFVRKTVRSLLDFTNFAPVDDIPLKPKEEAHIFF